MKTAQAMKVDHSDENEDEDEGILVTDFSFLPSETREVKNLLIESQKQRWK
jgi:hypothetical protein